MGNTGRKIITTLRKYNTTTSMFTGDVKDNVPGDPDYIPPVLDPTTCPVSTSYTCPVPTIVKGYDSIKFFFSLIPGEYANPDLFRIVVICKLAGTPVQTLSLLKSGGNYFTGTFSGLTNGSTYTIDVRFEKQDATVLQTCTTTNTVILNVGAACATITGLAVGSYTTSGATFTWDAVAGASGYQYQLDDGPFINIGNVTSYVLTGTTHRPHVFKIRAIDGLACPQISSINFTILGTGNFVIANNSDAVIEISPTFFILGGDVYPTPPFTRAEGTQGGQTGVITIVITGDIVDATLLINGAIIQTLSHVTGTVNFSSVSIAGTDNVEFNIL